MTSPIPGDAFASGEAKCAQCGQPAVYTQPHETLCVNCGGYFMVDLDDEGYQKPSTEAQYRSEGKTMDEVLRNDPTWIPTDEELMKGITIVSVLDHFRWPKYLAHRISTVWKKRNRRSTASPTKCSKPSAPN
jgi:hypothetical protein